MAERITQNPHLEVLPDHMAVHYDAIQDLMVNAGLSAEEVVQSLNNSWVCGHKERIRLWDRQIAEDLRIEEEECQCLLEQEDLLCIQKEQDLENERQETEKKKPKMNDFSETTLVNNFIIPRPSQYAL